MPVAPSEMEVKKIADPIIKNVLESFNSNNYTKMAVHFGEIMYRTFPQAKFDSMRKAVFELSGQIKSADFVASITQADNTVIVYKAHGEKTDLFIRLVLSTEKDKVMIVGLWFD